MADVDDNLLAPLPPPIARRYLLIIHIPVYCDSGRRYTDPLWLKDLLLHLDYITNFTIACPRIQAFPPHGFVPIDDARIAFVDLPSRIDTVKSFPATALRLWSAIGDAEFVHSGLGGWLPVSLGNLAAFITRLRNRQFMVIVESSTWRLLPGVPVAYHRRLRSSLAEFANRWCINRTDLAIFTQAEYKKSLMTRRTERGHVINATWIDKARILSTTDAALDWQRKCQSVKTPLRLLFAGRLTDAKGVLPMLKALNLLEANVCEVHLDIMGEGELDHVCHSFAAQRRIATRLRLLGIVEYGLPFFTVVRQYHAVIVPSISDEQPRIVYDAYAQGVPVLVSDTPGLRDCVMEDQTGKFFAKGNSESMAALLAWSAENLPLLQKMGLRALEIAKTMTHQNMHQRRWRILDKFFSSNVA